MAASLGGLDVARLHGRRGGARAARSAAARVDGLGFLGLALDATANEAATAPATARSACAGGAVRTFVIAAREDLEMAANVRSVLRSEP